jgi:hypothetical protein
VTGRGAWLALVIGIACGVIVWALSMPLAGVREPFDSNTAYYPVAMFVSGAVAAAASPRHWWLAVIGIFLGERLYGYAMLPEGRDWLLFGIVINAIIPTWLPAAMGAITVYIWDKYRSNRGLPRAGDSSRRDRDDT